MRCQEKGPSRFCRQTTVLRREHSEALGFTPGYFHDRYEILRRGPLVVHLEARGYLVPSANDTSCYWACVERGRAVQRIHRAWTSLRGIPSLVSPCDESWGMRELALRDPSGNLIRVGHELVDRGEPSA
jgi:hypothetical protein